MATVIALASSKGGTGKSTLAYHLGAYWAHRGRDVLLVDLDPQGNASLAMGPIGAWPDVAHSRLLFARRTPEPVAVSEGLRLLWADTRLTVGEAKQPQDIRRAAGRIRELTTDLAVLDAPSGLHPLTRLALVAAQHVVCPVDPSPFAVQGTLQLADGLADLRHRHGKAAQLAGVVLNMAEPRTRLHQRIEDTIREIFGRERYLGSLRRSVRVRESVVDRTPLHLRPGCADLASELKAVANRILRRVEST